jgi:peptidoglycan/LPS O-acetylase OafA/YrhL
MDKKLESLQALRGIAAFLVIFFHYRFFLKEQGETGQNIWDALFGWGIIGVDIFFVISGFIMIYTTQHYAAKISSAKRFLINRAIRIIPLYYIGLLIAFFLSGAMSTFHYPDKVQNLFSALTFTVYKTSITPHYIDDGGMYNVRWTLNYEVYFYIAFALCLLVKHLLLALIVFGIVMVGIIPFMAGFQPTVGIEGYPFSSPALGLLTNPLFLEFIIGAAAGYLYIKLKNKFLSNNMPIVAGLIALFLFIYIAFGIKSGEIRAFNIESTILIALFVLFLTLGEPVIKKIIPRVLVYLGEISFSLYLLHGAIGIAVVKRMSSFEPAEYRGAATVLIAISLSIFVAHLTHKNIEVRLTRVLKNKFLPKSESRQITENPAG